MIDVEVFGEASTPSAPNVQEIRRLCEEAAANRGLADGHVAIEFVDARRITELNAEHRGKASPTDVLSFPIDGAEAPAGGAGAGVGAEEPVAGPPRELGDIVICPAHTIDLREAVVHGMLHLLGMDHEHDDGEMLELQQRLLAVPPR